MSETKDQTGLNFRAAYCQVYHCTPDQFNRQVFRQCLHRRALPIAPLIGLLWPTFFDYDKALIREAGEVVTGGELSTAINSFRQDCERDAGYVHNQLRLRISGRRLFRLFSRVQSQVGVSGRRVSENRA